MSLPRSWRFRPVSTATDVVLRAMPPISAACRCQRRTRAQNANAAANGTANDTTPMDRLAFQWPRSDTGSISAPGQESEHERADAGQECHDVGLGDMLADAGDVPCQAADHNLHERSRDRDLDADDRGEQRHAEPNGSHVVQVHAKAPASES